LEIGAQLKADIAARKEQIYLAQQQALAQSSRSAETARAKQQKEIIEQYKMTSPEIDARLLEPKDRALLVPWGNEVYMAKDIKQANDLRAAAPVMQGLREDVSALSQHIESTNPAQRVGDWIGRTDRYGEIQAIGAATKLKLKTLYQLGVLSDKEYIRMDNMVPDATDVISGSSGGRYRAIMSDLDGTIRGQIGGLQKIVGLQGQKKRIEVGAPVFPTE